MINLIVVILKKHNIIWNIHTFIWHVYNNVWHDFMNILIVLIAPKIQNSGKNGK